MNETGRGRHPARQIDSLQGLQESGAGDVGAFDLSGFQDVARRADGFIVGAQASGDAHALRHFVGFSALKRSVFAL